MTFKPTREMYDRYSAVEIAAFRCRARDGVEYAVVADRGSRYTPTLVVPLAEADGEILFSTEGKEDPA